MQKTPLFDEYERHNAKVVDFHGWALPVQFSGIIQEHLHTRKAAGLFDCSHMGEFLIQGADAIAHVDRLVYSDFINLPVGRCRYSAILNENAGIIDDCVALRIDENTLYLVTNAGPLEKISPLITGRNSGATDVTNDTTKIDLQGPLSREILLEIGIAELAPLKYWNGARATWRGRDIIVTRAGYTGELGYELFVPNDIGTDLWRALSSHPNVLPCGLGARDTLRTEVGYPLYGEDLFEDKTPLESGMERFIVWEKDFVGKEKMQQQLRDENYTRLVAVESADRRAPRHGMVIKYEGDTVGKVTSGTFGPSVGVGVGLADLPARYTEIGTALTAGERDLPIEVAEIPIYKHGTCRVKV